MNGKNSIFHLLNIIQETRAITPNGKPVSINAIHELRQFTRLKLENILEKLEKDERVLTVVDQPSPSASWYVPRDRAHCDLKLLPEFDTYFKNIQADPDYQEFTGTKPPAHQPETITPTQKVTPRFDSSFSAIVFDNIIIPIPKDSNQSELCTVLFKNAASLKRSWDNDSIAEKLGENEIKKTTKYYTAARNINTAVALKTKISDLLLATPKAIQFNPSYL